MSQAQVVALFATAKTQLSTIQATNVTQQANLLAFELARPWSQPVATPLQHG